MSRRHSITFDSIEFALVSMTGLSSDCAKRVPDPIIIGIRIRGRKRFFMVGDLSCCYSNLEKCPNAQAFYTMEMENSFRKELFRAKWVLHGT